VNNEWERKRKEAVVAGFEILSRHVPGGAKKLTNFMELSPSWEVANCAATQELSNIL
jgi:hypothetical protein